jgi:broad specificity phosphatase PhoE
MAPALSGNRTEDWAQELQAKIEAVHAAKAAPSASPAAAAAPAASGKKTIYLVRHAESMSNKTLRGRSPLTRPFYACKVGFDAVLSPEGCEQLQEVRPDARSLLPDLEAVLFSPLVRAEQTAYVLFGEEAEGNDADQGPVVAGYRRPAQVSSGDLHWGSLLGLREERPAEWAEEKLGCYPKTKKSKVLVSRIRHVMEFLAAVPFQTFALVGHSIFLRTMLGQARKLGNSDIWVAELDLSAVALALEKKGREQPFPATFWLSKRRLFGPAPSRELKKKKTDWAKELQAELKDMREKHQARAARLRAAKASKPAAAKSGVKTIYLIRHAESMSNKILNEHKNPLTRPFYQCQVGFDAVLSPEGREQLQEVRPAARAILPKLEAVLFSPLLRAEETAHVLFGEDDAAAPCGYSKPSAAAGGDGALVWRPLLAMREERPAEWAEEWVGCYGKNKKSKVLLKRLAYCKDFLDKCPYSTFAIVGHSIWMRTMLGQKEKIGNSQIVVAELHPGKDGGPPTLENPRLVASPECYQAAAAAAEKKAGGGGECSTVGVEMVAVDNAAGGAGAKAAEAAEAEAAQKKTTVVLGAE